MKNILKKARDSRQDPYLALLALRNTPIDDNIGSPVQQLMGRRTRTILPTTKRLLQPKTIRPSSVRKSILRQQERQKYYHDRSSKPLPPLSAGEKVMIKENKTWKPATVSGKANGPRSYFVTTQNGQTYRRNRMHLRRFPTLSHLDDEDDTLQTTPPANDDTGERDAPLSSVNEDAPDDTPAAESQPDAQPLRRSTRSVNKPERFVETHTSHF